MRWGPGEEQQLMDAGGHTWVARDVAPKKQDGCLSKAGSLSHRDGSNRRVTVSHSQLWPLDDPRVGGRGHI